MVIKKIEIGGFGKLENYSTCLKSGTQVIYGPNEFGKSTLMEFLKIMFYSKRGGEKASSKDKILRQRYTPWSGTQMKGSVEFTHKGNLYKIQKEINSESPKKDVVLIFNKSTGEKITLGKNEEAGEHFFGVDIKSFERSSYIKNIGKSDFEKSKDSKDNKDSLSDKILSNLSDTAESDTSKSLVTKRLDEAIKDLQPTRGNGGKIFQTKSLISEINQKIFNLRSFEINTGELIKKLSDICELRKELACLQAKVENAERFHKLSKINLVIKLIEDKEKYIANLKMTRLEARDFINKMMLKKEKSKNCMAKVRELRNVMDSVDRNIVSISKEDFDFLNLKLRKKETLETEIREINYVLKSERCFLNEDTDFYRLIHKNFNKRELLSRELEKLKKEQVLLENSAKEAEFKLSVHEKEFEKFSAGFKKKKLSITVLQIINVFIFIMSLCVGFFAGVFVFFAIYALPFILFCGYGVRFFKKSKENTQLLTEELNMLKKHCDEQRVLAIGENQSKISEVLIEIDNLENSIQKTLADKLKITELSLFEIKKTINEMLDLKNCSSVQDYYEKCAKFQSISEIRNSYGAALEELKNIENDFVKSVSKYHNASDFNEALSMFKNFTFLNSEIDHLEEKIECELSTLGFEVNDVKVLKEYAENLNLKDEVAKLEPEEFEKISKRIEFLKNLGLEEKYIEVQKNIKSPPENAEKLNENLITQKNKLSDMEKYSESLQIALSVIEESSDELRKNFNPKLNKRVSEIFSCLTDGKYNQMHVEKNYGMLVSDDMIDRNCDNFSSGTIDQAYLSLRIAISELISGENNMPLILDDVFMQYDDARLDKVLEFLKSYPLKNEDDCQIIIFTCHKHVCDIALDKQIPVISAC